MSLCAVCFTISEQDLGKHVEVGPSGMTGLSENHCSPSHTFSGKKKKTYSYSLSSSTITCFSIANQSRATNPNRQSSEVVSINRSSTLSQLQPIRERTYVTKLQWAPRGHANVMDLPHDLPLFFCFFLSCKKHWCDKICEKTQRDAGFSVCVSFVEEVIKSLPLITNTLTSATTKGLIKSSW